MVQQTPKLLQKASRRPSSNRRTLAFAFVAALGMVGVLLDGVLNLSSRSKHLLSCLIQDLDHPTPKSDSSTPLSRSRKKESI
jgi:hypothetical protein